MPLQNRVDPYGIIQSRPERGLFYGNRGGRFHRDDKTLAASRWKSRAWIICLCTYKGWHREIFGAGYTGLFFMDEPTALAAGHRPCFLCRRPQALAYSKAISPGRRLRAGEIDTRLDAERRDGRAKRLHVLNCDQLPDGAMYADGDSVFAVKGSHILRWSYAGYGASSLRPAGRLVHVLTPPASLAALTHGYAPVWGGHNSAGASSSES